MKTASVPRPAAPRRAEWPPDTEVALVEDTVSGLLRAGARSHPDVVALVATTHAGEHRRWTYAELLAAARHSCGSLLSVADPGDHVAIWAPNVAEWPIMQYAAALAGVTLVALDPALRLDELDHCLRLSQASVLIHADSGPGRTDMAEVVAQVAPTIPDLLEVISFSDVGRLYGSPVEPDELSAPDAPAMILFTAAATGSPRAALLSHRSLVNNARLTMLTSQAEPGVVTLAALPCAHPACCVIAHLGTAALGGTLVPLPAIDTDTDPTHQALLATIADEHPSLLISTAAALGPLPRTATSIPVRHPGSVLVAGATVPAGMIETVEQALGASVRTLYGQPELSAVTCLGRPSAEGGTTVGPPLPHTGVRIVDPTTGHVQPLGVVGEVRARGHSQMIGYFDDPGGTAAAVDAEGWLRTGDLGAMDEHGVITLAGRLSR